MVSPQEPTAHIKRADARHNVEQILQVAQEVFAELGYQASIAEVARRSGLGMGTIYRHFANKTVLMEYIAVKVMRESLDEVRAALEKEPGSWASFTRVAQTLTRLRASQIFPPARGTTAVSAPAVSELRSHLLDALEKLTVCTQRAGVLRRDVTAYDIVLLLDSIPARTPAPRDADHPAPDLPARHVAILLDGLRAHDAVDGQALPLPAPSRDDIDHHYRSHHDM